MAQSYNLPSWLETQPGDIAKQFVSGLQVGAQLGEARNKLAASQQQAAMETQVKQQQLEANTLQQAQELQVSKAYKDQQIALQQQQIEAAQQKVALATAQAARQFQFQKSYQNRYGELVASGKTPDESSRISMFENLPMFGTGAGAASAIRGVGNTQADIPQTMKFTDEKGNTHNILFRGKGSTTHDLDSKSNAGEVWQQHHDIVRSEKESDTQRAAQITDLKDQLKAETDEDKKTALRSKLDGLLNPKLNMGAAAAIPTSDAVTPNAGIPVTGPSSNVGLFNSTGGSAPASTSAAIATPKTQAELNALESGTLFVNPADGKTYRKK